MNPEALDNVHILIVGGKPGNARLLGGILVALGVSEVKLAADTGRALELLARRDFQAVFCHEAVGPLDTQAFVTTIRRGEVRNPRIPILITASAPNRAQVERMRDTGINDVIVLPLTAGAVKRKLLGILAPVKGFVEAESYFGPDRRRAYDRRHTRQATQRLSLQERRRGRRMRRLTDTET